MRLLVREAGWPGLYSLRVTWASVSLSVKLRLWYFTSKSCCWMKWDRAVPGKEQTFDKCSLFLLSVLLILSYSNVLPPVSLPPSYFYNIFFTPMRISVRYICTLTPLLMELSRTKQEGNSALGREKLRLTREAEEREGKRSSPLHLQGPVPHGRPRRR